MWTLVHIRTVTTPAVDVYSVTLVPFSSYRPANPYPRSSALKSARRSTNSTRRRNSTERETNPGTAKRRQLPALCRRKCWSFSSSSPRIGTAGSPTNARGRFPRRWRRKRGVCRQEWRESSTRGCAASWRAGTASMPRSVTSCPAGPAELSPVLKLRSWPRLSSLAEGPCICLAEKRAELYTPSKSNIVNMILLWHFTLYIKFSAFFFFPSLLCFSYHFTMLIFQSGSHRC